MSSQLCRDNLTQIQQRIFQSSSRLKGSEPVSSKISGSWRRSTGTTMMTASSCTKNGELQYTYMVKQREQ